jgi:hypothetical protein
MVVMVEDLSLKLLMPVERFLRVRFVTSLVDSGASLLDCVHDAFPSISKALDSRIKTLQLRDKHHWAFSGQFGYGL